MTDKNEGPVNSSGMPYYTVTSPAPNGLNYKVNPAIKNKNNLKNAYNTDIAREKGLVKESEDEGGP